MHCLHVRVNAGIGAFLRHCDIAWVNFEGI